MKLFRQHILLIVVMVLLSAVPITAEESAPAIDAPRGDTIAKEAAVVETAGENDTVDEAAVLIASKKAQPVIAYWKDDFVLSTPDERFMMKIRGNIHFDTKFHSDDSVNPTQFDLRRARIDLQGTFYSTISFRLQTEFADSPYIRNAYVDIAFRPWLHLWAGQMKPPFSTSWWTQDNNVNFIERGAGTPIYPFFDRGWWLLGDLFGGALTYNIAAFTGAGMDYDYNKGDVDNNKDVFVRLYAIPFKKSPNTLLNNLHLCLQGSTGEQSVPTKRFEQKGFGGPIRDLKYWTWETEKTGTASIDRRDRWGAELHYIVGPFSFSTEYLVCSYTDIVVSAIDGTPVINQDGDVMSWSTWVSWFPTGEEKSVSNLGWRTARPQHDFDPATMKGTGAWEILARYTLTETSKDLFTSVSYANESYRILKGAPTVHEYSLGVNWTWNAMLRWQLNYTHVACDEDSGSMQAGSSEYADGTEWVSTEDLVALRLIFKI